MTALPSAAVGPDAVVWASGALTAVVGLFVAALAYRGYRRNGAHKMRALAVGIGLLTAGVFLAVVLATWSGVGAGLVLLVRGLVTVAGLAAVLYALLRA
ncbi:DUF7521 family protein [Haloarcula laminariae]|uniref:DUF7521 family protein n=1 Tax=Haloarcula laminariae TaxID=2961577 RepID=UPI0021C5DAAC|nr:MULTISPECIES: hypothetical protein [Halomicroarcula]